MAHGVTSRAELWRRREALASAAAAASPEPLGYVVVERQHSAAEIVSWVQSTSVLDYGTAVKAAEETEEHTPLEAVVCELRPVAR